jgi:hypothetical protein
MGFRKAINHRWRQSSAAWCPIGMCVFGRPTIGFWARCWSFGRFFPLGRAVYCRMPILLTTWTEGPTLANCSRELAYQLGRDDEGFLHKDILKCIYLWQDHLLQVREWFAHLSSQWRLMDQSYCDHILWRAKTSCGQFSTLLYYFT